MRLALVAALLAWVAVGADSFAAQYGPRVTHEADEQPLAEVLEAVGRQLNRRLELAGRQTEAARPVTLRLTDATAGEALLELEELVGARAMRRSRERYVLQPVRDLPGFVGQPIGAWRLWLESVAYALTSTIYPADPARRYARESTYGQFRFDAPSDADAVRLRRLRQVPLGLEPARGQRQADVLAPDSNDPRQWRLQALLETPAAGVTAIERADLLGDFAPAAGRSASSSTSWAPRRRWCRATASGTFSSKRCKAGAARCGA